MSLDTSTLADGRVVTLVGLGALGLAVVILVSQNRKQKEMLEQMRQVKLLNHPHFDVVSGEFDWPEEVQQRVEEAAEAQAEG